MTNMETLLAQAGTELRARRRPFDVGAGLRRLAEDAGYVQPSQEVPPVSRARQQLSVVVRWALNQTGAAVHVERLAQEIGEDGLDGNCAPLKDLDVDGAHIFACMLHLADHPESAQFWWQLAAGAGKGAAAYCLYLHHLGRGENPEATHWLYQLQHSLDGPDDAFVTWMGEFAVYVRRNCPPQGTRQPEPGITAEVERLAARDDTDAVLVCRPEREIADRLQHFAQQH
ncbi:hypothetical protein AB0N81_07885 [Streptomyces sp. NPDC093510]|uniref:hypothetical protein n=1 Tax=Streptomyces sp. NPDC093510 TaxID=3155199 RepID=UPI003435F59D